MPWYSYVSGDPADVFSYLYSGPNAPTCPGGPTLCAIYAAYSVLVNPFPAAIEAPLYADIIAAILNQAHRGNAYVKQ